MAEHPDIPSGRDDEVPTGAFDALGLGSLADDVRADRAGWAAIESAAARRHAGRRPWFVSAAAAVALILGVSAVLVARSGREDVVATGSGAAGTYVLPPADATDVTATQQAGGSLIWYTDATGTAWALRQGLSRSLLATTGTTLALGQDSDSPGTVDLPNLGRTVLVCRTGLVAPESPNVMIAVPSVTAVFAVGNGTGLLAPVDDTGASCSLDDPVVVAASQLRLVSGTEFERYIGKVPLSLPDTAVDTTVPMVGETTTTVAERPPADTATAEEQIAAAVADWNARADDGSYTHLEDGTAKAAEYADKFATAARQSGAAKAGDGSGNHNGLVSVRFVTPERASIVMSMTAVLPTGTYTFERPGEAILQDGRWVITYRTVVEVLGQACIPPGGYDGCPTG